MQPKKEKSPALFSKMENLTCRKLAFLREIMYNGITKRSIAVSKLELLRLLEEFEGEVELADFSPQELSELLEKLQGDDGAPLTKEQFKEKYFAYYDDVKDKSLKKQDW